MIETKDDVELFERLEREFADERELMHDMQRDLEEVKRLVSPELSRPKLFRWIAAALVAAVVFAAIGFGAGMLVQYQQTEEARDQLARIGSVAIPKPYAEFADTAAREGGMYSVNMVDEKAAPYGRGPANQGQQPSPPSSVVLAEDPTPGQAPGR